MNGIDALRLVLEAFERAKVPHAISGSLSAMAYGELRSTKDADIVIGIGWEPLRRIFDELEPAFEVDRQLRWEGITRTSRFVLKHRDSRS